MVMAEVGEASSSTTPAPLRALTVLMPKVRAMVEEVTAMLCYTAVRVSMAL